MGWAQVPHASYDTAKPWTYWWWLGSAAQPADIQAQLEAFAQAGLGGVHIIPIYGVKGEEAHFLPFLSEDWMQAVQFAQQEARRLGLGLDLTLGTGWPFGGPFVKREQAAKKWASFSFEQNLDRNSSLNLDSLRQAHNWLSVLGVVVERGDEAQTLTVNPEQAKLPMDLRKGSYTLTAFGLANTRQRVKRAAPGGEGLVMDYFSPQAVESYLAHFDSVFAHTAHGFQPRSFYHDSYEVYQANGSRALLAHFEQARGYDLLDELPILLDEAHPERPYLLRDLRKSMSEQLYQAFAQPWTQWCKDRGTLSRLQAHGSPGNLLDLYGLAAVPETESFGCSNFAIPGLGCDPDYEENRFGRPSPLMMKFASSPAHLMGKPLVSSETGTWLGNHFKVSLRQIKPQIDELFVSGINHVFYHGIPYSPPDAPFPGWLFYASTHVGPASHFWEELPLLNGYIEDCQRRLQAAQPDNDVLLYFPTDELWSTYPGDPLLLLDVHKYRKWFGETAFGKTAKQLWEGGYAFDYVSDRHLQDLYVQADGALSMGKGSEYRVVVVPAVRFLSEETAERLATLANRGAKVVFVDQWPEQAAGLLAHRGNGPGLEDPLERLKNSPQVQLDTAFPGVLQQWSIRREEMKAKGLSFIRKRRGEETLYFITNLGDAFYEDSLELAASSTFVEIYDPMRKQARVMPAEGGILLQLPPGASCFVTTRQSPRSLPAWAPFEEAGHMRLEGPWDVRFVAQTGEALPKTYRPDSLISWTEWGAAELQPFCGKGTYRTSFRLEDLPAGRRHRLRFEGIHETAEVRLNGVRCGTVWALPHELELPAIALQEENELEIRVQNLSANRIKHIDMQGIEWKKFYDINFVDIQYKPFDASGWAWMPSGLLGRVELVWD